MNPSSQQQAVDQAITSRRSIRAFLPTPVSREEIEAILQAAETAIGNDLALGSGATTRRYTAPNPFTTVRRMQQRPLA